MRKVIFNKWFFLAALLLISLSAFSFAAYKSARPGQFDDTCCSKPTSVPVKEKGEMILDAVTRQFTALISIQ